MVGNSQFSRVKQWALIGMALLVISLPSVASAKAGQATKKTNSEKKAEKRALKFGRRLQSLAQLGKNFSQIKKKPTQPVVYPEKVPVRLVHIQNMIEQGQLMMRAMPASFPVRGRISSVFGPRRHPRSQDYRIHSGIDIVAAFGAPVTATADGRVVFSGDRAGYGKVIVLDHGYGYQTVYAHCSRLLVPVGVRIVRGQIISHVGKSGHATGTHLHYEVRKNGQPI
ncbi:M23 family metallopeptidase, partial [bacterium]|nr:M23 family metallopeptidase [bacterium]